MISFEQAIAITSQAARPIGRETMALAGAADRVLARDVIARLDSPRRDVSAMDGYAVVEADLLNCDRLKVVGESAAGQSELPTVRQGECARIFTGAALPAGADRVVIQEMVQRQGDWAIFQQPLRPPRHIRPKGSDFASGERLLASGTLLGPRALVVAAAADVADVEVYRRPRVGLLATGDELAEPGSALSRAAAIPESVSFGVAALGERWGGICALRICLPDDPGALERAATKALQDADMLVVTGGASVGERDFAKSMFSAAELDLLFSRVAIKPGKPVWLGRSAGKLILGLPGNPTSAMVTARLFLAPLIAGMSGRDPAVAQQWRRARLCAPLPASGERETFVRARWSADEVEPLASADSGAQRELLEAELLVRLPRNAPSATGDAVSILDF